METKDPKNSVHENEPFGQSTENASKAGQDSQESDSKKVIDNKEITENKEVESQLVSPDTPDNLQEEQALSTMNVSDSEEGDVPKNEDAQDPFGKNMASSDPPGPFKDEDKSDSIDPEGTSNINVPDSEKEGLADNRETQESASEEEESETESLPEENREVINFALLKKPDLIEIIKELLNSGKINEIGPDITAIKTSFYKQYHAEIEQKKAAFLKNGGNIEDFSPGYSVEEENLRSLLKKYADLRFENSKMHEDEKAGNLNKKHQIIEEIKDLVHRDESINRTFQEFRDLQRRWHEVGPVPQGELKNLWETYHYHVEKFYDYIKINNELRDLDLKKNLEAKIILCEKAEALLLEPNIVNAFKSLQKFHDQWREIGPVPKEQRSEIWERFREATSKLNKNHQQYYHDLKESQKKNLDSKILLCEKAEEIAKMEISDHEVWVDKTHEIIDIQKVWKTIGFAPKKDNNKIYARFRAACDKFFSRKREYYAQGLEEQQENLQKKLELCIQAEALKDNTDWKKTTDELILLQKKWKNIGPVPRKRSDQVWKRFRAACDHFFEKKSEFFSTIENTYDKNLAEKEKLIEEIKAFQPGESLKENLNQLNDFQRKWSEIGFVPFEKKDEIMQLYRDAINEKYDSLEMDEHKKNVLKFRNKLDDIRNKPRPQNKLRFEREKLMNKLQQLKNDIVVWENNIGFFAESKKADSMVRDFEKKIEIARKNIKLYEDKILMIDELDE